MAKKVDIAAQKERRQKIILAVGAVVFLALAVIQGPKLWKQLNPPAPAATAAPAEATAPATGDPAATQSTPSGGATPVTTPAPGAPIAVLAGVQVAPSPEPPAEENQLWSFSRLEPKDPFEQEVSEEAEQPSEADGSGAAPTAKAKAAPKTPQAPATSGASPSATAVGGPTAATGVAVVPAADPTNATIAVNGKPQQLELKDVFPKPDRAFVLIDLTANTAKIGVAGGGFTEGKTVSLKLGRQLTFVDTATGARYVVKLLYTGAGPEQVATFSSTSSK